MTNASISHNADWFTTTRDMLNTAIDTRDGALLRRVALRLNGHSYATMPMEQRDALARLWLKASVSAISEGWA